MNRDEAQKIAKYIEDEVDNFMGYAYDQVQYLQTHIRQASGRSAGTLSKLDKVLTRIDRDQEYINSIAKKLRKIK